MRQPVMFPFAMCGALACGGSSQPGGGTPADSGSDQTGSGANTPATAGTVSLQPDPAIAGRDALRCEVLEEAADADGDPLSQVFSWTVDGEDAGVDEAEVPPDRAHEGQSWQCHLEVDDGTTRVSTSSEPAEVQPWTILETAPTLDVDVSPDPLVPGETATITYTGALANSEELSVTYGFNGWRPIDEDVEFQAEPYDNVVEYYFLVAELEPLDSGGFEIEIELPADTRALHMVFDDGDTIDDSDGREYHATAEFPYLGPYLSWTDEAGPTDGIVISWETRTASLGAVAWGTEALNRVSVGERIDTLHQVALTDLDPDTTYRYQVLDMDGQAGEQWTFTTAPLDAESYRFAVASDMQDPGTDANRWAELSDRIVDDHAPDFLYMPGDLVADDRPGFWWAFFARAPRLLAQTPLVPMPGNHDTPTIDSDADTSSYQRYFALPEASGSEDYYELTYGNGLFLSISTEDAASLEVGGDQHTWLDEVLSTTWDGDTRSHTWVFAGYHHPSYDAGQRFADETILWRDLTASFDGRVDLVFMAHEHLYQRFLPLSYDSILSDEYGVSDGQGVGYIVLPASGGGAQGGQLVSPDGPEGYHRALLAYPEVGEAQSHVEAWHGYVIVDIDGPTATVGAWRLPEESGDAHVLEDEFELRRPDE